MVLLFPTSDKLIRFRLAVNPKIYEVNFKEKTLFCLCNEEQVELENYVYGAEILNMQVSQN